MDQWWRKWGRRLRPVVVATGQPGAARKRRRSLLVAGDECLENGTPAMVGRSEP